MDDILDFLFKPIIVVIRWIFQVVLLAVFEFCHEYIGWVVGWCFWRTVTVGQYPKEGVWYDDKASLLTNIIVTFTGFVLIAGLITLVIVF